MTHVALVCAAARPGHLIMPPLVAGLCIMRQTQPELYRKARVKGLTWDEASYFLQPTEGSVLHEEWTREWWKFATGGELSEDKTREYEIILSRYNVRDRRSLIPLMADYIDDLWQQRDLPDAAHAG